MLAYWAYFIVNDGVRVNYCNLQMWCVVCHPVPLKHDIMILMWGKSKGLMSYNKKHGTSVLKKFVSREQLDQYKKVGGFFIFIEGVKN
jgi:hypothetical protein